MATIFGTMPFNISNIVIMSKRAIVIPLVYAIPSVLKTMGSLKGHPHMTIIVK